MKITQKFKVLMLCAIPFGILCILHLLKTFSSLPNSFSFLPEKIEIDSTLIEVSNEDAHYFSKFKAYSWAGEFDTEVAKVKSELKEKGYGMSSENDGVWSKDGNTYAYIYKGLWNREKKETEIGNKGNYVTFIIEQRHPVNSAWKILRYL